jgi:hypothetical protein
LQNGAPDLPNDLLVHQIGEAAIDLHQVLQLVKLLSLLVTLVNLRFNIFDVI